MLGRPRSFSLGDRFSSEPDFWIFPIWDEFKVDLAFTNPKGHRDSNDRTRLCSLLLEDDPWKISIDQEAHRYLGMQ